MPIVKSPTKTAFKANVKKEIKAGKPQKQAVAIAYSAKKEAEHKKQSGSQMKWSATKKPKEVVTDRGTFGFKGK
jgi:hypothetical protein